jgi:hypothetical protein
MNLIIQHELFKEIVNKSDDSRDAELDAKESDAIDEKIYE